MSFSYFLYFSKNYEVISTNHGEPWDLGKTHSKNSWSSKSIDAQVSNKQI